MLYRPSPKVLHGWRRLLLRLFGARIGINAHPYPSAKIWAPWNLEMGDHSCLSEKVDCYSVDFIRLGPHAIVSQYSFLCTASHDYNDPTMPLITAPIIVEAGAWVAADVFIGPGVRIGEGAVVGARSTVFRNVQPWMVVAGNPLKVIRRREISCGVATPAEATS
jgi:putative colanic acid biosynthesis acetyltransferase WcaF